MATERSVVIFSQGTYGLPCTLEEWFRNGRIIIWIYKREGQRRQVSGK